VGHNKQISGKLRITYRTIFLNLLINLFLSSNGMYPEFYYKLQKSNIIAGIRLLEETK